MQRIGAAVIALALVAGTATASEVEDETGQHVQHDGGIEGDAPDTCEGATERAIEVDADNRTSGLLVPVDDEADFYGVQVTSSWVGQRIRVTANLSFFNGHMELYEPDCAALLGATEPQTEGGEDSGFGSAVALGNGNGKDGGEASSSGESSEPSKGISAEIPDEYECAEDWKFLLKMHKGRTVPSSIHVRWSHGEEADVNLTQLSQGQVAKFVTDLHPQFTIEEATADVDESWGTEDGSGGNEFFKLVHGSCEANQWFPPFVGSNYVEFTPTASGAYPIGVFYDPDDEGDFTGAHPQGCHHLGCDGAIEQGNQELGYLLDAAGIGNLDQATE